MTKEMIKPFVWGIVVGAIVLAIVIFSAGWVVTKGKAEQMAKQAVVDKLASICVAQFLQDANKEERLKELKATDSWQRDSYVEKGGWATMPGEDSPDSMVADECAKRLSELGQLRSFHPPTSAGQY
jgi:hypothetical protein